IGLTVPTHFEPGTTVTVELYQGDQGFLCALPVKVVRTAAAPGGGWLLGCSLLHPLRESQLKALREGSCPTPTWKVTESGAGKRKPFPLAAAAKTQPSTQKMRPTKRQENSDLDSLWIDLGGED